MDASKNKAKGILGESKGNESNGGSHSGKAVGFDKVETKNRFDLLGEENDSMNTDVWNDVKSQVKAAYDIGLPISENVVKNWNDEMIGYYMVKCKQRTVNRSSPE